MGKEKTITVVVKHLTGEEIPLTVPKTISGHELYEEFTDRINLKSETEYFGLLFLEANVWLDPLVKVKKQLKEHAKPEIGFRVRYYVVNPGRLIEEYTKYLFYLQLRHDIFLEGFVDEEDVRIELGGYIVQAELGDAQGSEDNYLSGAVFIPLQSISIERAIIKVHRSLRGMSQHEAESAFIVLCSQQELYGVDLHEAMTKAKETVFLGFCALGVKLFQDAIRKEIFKWGDIVNMQYKDKKMKITLKPAPGKPTLYSFKFPDKALCLEAWQSGVQQHLFFRRRTHGVGNTGGILAAIGLRKKTNPIDKSRFYGRNEQEAIALAKRKHTDEEEKEGVHPVSRVPLLSLPNRSAQPTVLSLLSTDEDASRNHFLTEIRESESNFVLDGHHLSSFSRASPQPPRPTSRTFDKDHGFMAGLAMDLPMEDTSSSFPRDSSSPQRSNASLPTNKRASILDPSDSMYTFAPSPGYPDMLSEGYHVDDALKPINKSFHDHVAPVSDTRETPLHLHASTTVMSDTAPLPQHSSILSFDRNSLRSNEQRRLGPDNALDESDFDVVGGTVAVVVAPAPVVKQSSRTMAGTPLSSSPSSEPSIPVPVPAPRPDLVRRSTHEALSRNMATLDNETSTDDVILSSSFTHRDSEPGNITEESDLSSHTAPLPPASSLPDETVEERVAHYDEARRMPAINLDDEDDESEEEKRLQFISPDTITVELDSNLHSEESNHTQTTHSSQNTQVTARLEESNDGSNPADPLTVYKNDIESAGSNGLLGSLEANSTATHELISARSSVKPVSDPSPTLAPILSSSKPVVFDRPLLPNGDRIVPPSYSPEKVYMKALFDYSCDDDQSVYEDLSFLNFQTNDILEVYDQTDPQWWRVVNLRTNQQGMVPSKSRIDAMLRIKGQTPTKPGRDEVFASFMQVAFRSPSPDLLRPIVLLGSCKDLIIDRLIDFFPDRFETCVPHTTRPQREEEEDGTDYFFVSLNTMESKMAAGEFAETVSFQGHLYGTSFDSIRAALKKGVHCLLDISDPYTIISLHKHSIHPVAILIKPASENVVSSEMPSLSKEAVSSLFAFSTMMATEQGHYFTAVLENVDFDETYQQVLDLITQETSQPSWVPVYAMPNKPAAIIARRRGSVNVTSTIPVTDTPSHRNSMGFFGADHGQLGVSPLEDFARHKSEETASSSLFSRDSSVDGADRKLRDERRTIEMTLSDRDASSPLEAQLDHPEPTAELPLEASKSFSSSSPQRDPSRNHMVRQASNHNQDQYCDWDHGGRGMGTFSDEVVPTRGLEDLPSIEVKPPYIDTHVQGAGPRLHDPATFMASERIRFGKGLTGLGFSFAGGIDDQYIVGDPHIYVTKIAPGGAAEQDGRLQIGDRIVEANGTHLANVTHARVLEILKSSANVNLMVMRKCKHVVLIPQNGRYGLGIKGGADVRSPVTISRIQVDSPAAKCSKLKIGYEITHVNGMSLKSSPHNEVLRMIQESKDKLELVIHPRVVQAAMTAPPRRLSAPSQVLTSLRHPGNPALGPRPAQDERPPTTSPQRLPSSPSPSKRGPHDGHPGAVDRPRSQTIVPKSHVAGPAPPKPLPRSLHPTALNNRPTPTPAPTVTKSPEQRLGSSLVGSVSSEDVLSDSILSSALPCPKVAITVGNFSAISLYRVGFSQDRDCAAAILPENAARNRYKDILPYDDTRIRLHESNDYVNANKVVVKVAGGAGLEGGALFSYVASQGPKDVTEEHFWKMIWDENITFVCMLTALAEGGRAKCSQYWPGPSSSLKTESDMFQIKSLEDINKDGFIRRRFELQHLLEGQSRSIFQYQLSSWPDHGVPSSPDCFLSFIGQLERDKKLVSSSTSTAPRAPILVHCSAGIGRTGVMIMVHVGLYMLQRGLPIDMPAMLIAMRTQRMGLIQTEVEFSRKKYFLLVFLLKP